jgi:hypothetical protein
LAFPGLALVQRAVVKSSSTSEFRIRPRIEEDKIDLIDTGNLINDVNEVRIKAYELFRLNEIALSIRVVAISP